MSNAPHRRRGAQFVHHSLFRVRALRR